MSSKEPPLATNREACPPRLVAGSFPSTDPKATTSGIQRTRTRPAGIMINIDNQDDFPALAKRVKSGVNRDTVGDATTSMSKTKNGGLLLEIRGDQTVVDTVRWR